MTFLLLPDYCKAAEKVLDIIIIIVLWLFLFLILYLVVVGILRVVQLILLLGGRTIGRSFGYSIRSVNSTDEDGKSFLSSFFRIRYIYISIFHSSFPLFWRVYFSSLKPKSLRTFFPPRSLLHHHQTRLAAVITVITTSTTTTNTHLSSS